LLGAIDRADPRRAAIVAELIGLAADAAPVVARAAVRALVELR